jgi:predicted nucleic acid-binding protein
MKRLVDASVAVKWAVVEPDSDRAIELYSGDLAAPAFMLLEVANILWKKVAQRQIVPAQALEALRHIQASVDTLPIRGFEPRALEIGCELAHPVYDCLYLALAEAMETRIISADRRLINRCAGTRFADLIEPFG